MHRKARLTGRSNCDVVCSAYFLSASPSFCLRCCFISHHLWKAENPIYISDTASAWLCACTATREMHGAAPLLWRHAHRRCCCSSGGRGPRQRSGGAKSDGTSSSISSSISTLSSASATSWRSRLTAAQACMYSSSSSPASAQRVVAAAAAATASRHSGADISRGRSRSSGALRCSASASDDVSASPSSQVPVAAYVHLPFCKRKCFYCDFPVEAVGANPSGRERERLLAPFQTPLPLLLRCFWLCACPPRPCLTHSTQLTHTNTPSNTHTQSHRIGHTRQARARAWRRTSTRCCARSRRRRVSTTRRASRSRASTLAAG